PPDLLRPRGIGEHARVGPQANGRVDQRAAAEPAADQNVDVGAEPEVEQPGAPAAPHLAADDLQLATKLGQAVGKFSSEEFAAALNDADLEPGARQPRGGNAAAIAGADHDHVVGGSEPLERRRQSLGHGFSIAQTAEPPKSGAASVLARA